MAQPLRDAMRLEWHNGVEAHFQEGADGAGRFAGTGWLHAKLTLVALMLVHFIVTGRWLKGAAKGKSLPSPTALRWFNELPLFGLIVVVWLVLAKPF